jgi:hypothetical protein
LKNLIQLSISEYSVTGNVWSAASRKIREFSPQRMYTPLDENALYPYQWIWGSYSPVMMGRGRCSMC